MQPGPAPEPGAPEQPGLNEQVAAFAVLGVDIDTLGLAVARQWGLADDVLHMIRRLPADALVRKPDADADMLRIVASAANEAVDALGLAGSQRVGAALVQVAQRYARVLGVNARDIHDALQSARDTLTRGIAVAAAPRAASAAPGTAPGATAVPAPAGVRASA
jgi:non-specific serine/threonine protein kinase